MFIIIILTFVYVIIIADSEKT